jgi:hypothetical protein
MSHSAARRPRPPYFSAAAAAAKQQREDAERFRKRGRAAEAAERWLSRLGNVCRATQKDAEAAEAEGRTLDEARALEHARNYVKVLQKARGALAGISDKPAGRDALQALDLAAVDMERTRGLTTATAPALDAGLDLLCQYLAGSGPAPEEVVELLCDPVLRRALDWLSAELDYRSGRSAAPRVAYKEDDRGDQEPSAAEVARSQEATDSGQGTAADPTARTLDLMRQTIANTKGGRTMGTTELIERAGVNRNLGLAALRELQRLGEYDGHKHKSKQKRRA